MHAHMDVYGTTACRVHRIGTGEIAITYGALRIAMTTSEALRLIALLSAVVDQPITSK